MTGLDIEKDKIIEMACIITDSDLNILAEVTNINTIRLFLVSYLSCELNSSFLIRQGPNLIINQPAELLDGMSEWCKEHHGKVSCLFLRGLKKK